MSMQNEGKESLFSEFTESSFEQWKEEAIKLLKGAPFEKKMISKTYEGIEIQPIYNSQDLTNKALKNTLPGTPPFSRHSSPEGYISNSWKMCQEIPGNSPEEFNQNCKKYISLGQNVVNIPLKVVENVFFSNTGVEINKSDDLELCLKDLDLGKIPLHVYTGENSLPFLVMLQKLWKDEFNNLEESIIGCDPVSQSLLTGELNPDLDRLTESIKFADEKFPNIKSILIRSDIFGDLGASAVQEIGLAVSIGVEYMKKMLDMGFDANKAASKIAFEFAVGQDYFTEISKFRAVKIIWYRVLKAFGCSDENSKIYIHARTGKYNKTISDQYVNMLRVTSEAFSAVLGGINSLSIGSFDELHTPMGEFSGRISRNLHSILKDECQLFHPIDPAGGSWYVEKLTESISLESWKYFQKIDSNNGIINSLKKRIPQDDILDTRNLRKKDISKRKRVIVGTNMFASNTEKITENYANATKGDSSKKNLSVIAKNTPEEIGKLYEDGVSFHDVYHGTIQGNREKIETIKFERLSEEFESLRYKVENGLKEKVYLVNMGSLRQHKPRADFSRGYFEVAGLEVEYPEGFNTPEAAAASFRNSGAKIAVICSTDDTYPELVPVISKLIKTDNPEAKIVLAGRPAKDLKEIYDQSGVDEYIYMGSECLKTLKNLLGVGE